MTHRDYATGRRTGLYDDLDGEPEAPSAAFWGAPRAPMTLALSADGGVSWPWRRNLETGDGYCLTNNSRDGLNRELSYPSVHQTVDGALHVAFTYHRKAIEHVVVDPSWVTAG